MDLLGTSRPRGHSHASDAGRAIVLLTVEAPFCTRTAVRAVEAAVLCGHRLLIVNVVSGVVLRRSIIPRNNSPLAETGWIGLTEPARMAVSFGVELVTQTLLATRPRAAFLRFAADQGAAAVHFAARDGYLGYREKLRWERDLKRAGLEPI